MMLEDAYRLHRERVLVWATIRGVPESDLEDVAHEVFKAFAEAAPAPREDAVGGWLRATTRHVAIRHQAKLSRRRSRELPDDYEHESPDQAPEGELGDHQVRAELLQLVARLERTRREVLVAHVLEEEPFEAIAERQGVPVETARKRLRLARRDMQVAIKRVREREERLSGAVSFGVVPLLFSRRGVWTTLVAVGFGGVLLAVAVVAAGRATSARLAPTHEETRAELREHVFQSVIALAQAEREPARATALLPVAVVPAPASLAELPEVDLVSLARRALLEGSPARALGYLARADRAYPSGSLLPERQALRTRAGAPR